MRKYSCILFDFDLTLVDSVEGILTTYRKTFESFGVPVLPDEVYRSEIPYALEIALSRMLPTVSAEQIMQMHDRFLELAKTYMTPGTTGYPGLYALFAELKKIQCTIGIVSSKRAVYIREFLVREGLEEHVDLIIGPNDVPVPKPAPDGILKALEMLRTDKEQVLYVGDAEFDAMAAERAGVAFAGVLYGAAGEKLREFPHVYLAENLNELRELLV